MSTHTQALACKHTDMHTETALDSLFCTDLLLLDFLVLLSVTLPYLGARAKPSAGLLVPTLRCPVDPVPSPHLFTSPHSPPTSPATTLVQACVISPDPCLFPTWQPQKHFSAWISLHLSPSSILHFLLDLE